jgi:hypothetical protein
MIKLTKEVVRSLVSQIRDKESSSLAKEDIPDLHILVKSLVKNKGYARSIASDVFGRPKIDEFIAAAKENGISTATAIYEKVNDAIKYHRENMPKVFRETFADVLEGSENSISINGVEFDREEFAEFIELASSHETAFRALVWKQATDGISLRKPGKPADPDAHAKQAAFWGNVVVATV